MKLFKSLFYFVLILATILTNTALSQDDNPDAFYTSTISEIEPKHSLTFEIGLPVIVGNKFNRTYMGGLIYVSPHYRYCFPNHLAIGVGAFYNYMNINAISISENIRGSNNIMGGYFKISHEKFYSARFGTDMGVKLGYAYSIYQSNKLKEAGRTSTDSGFYIEPTIGLVVTVAERSSFRFFVGYNLLGMPFDNTRIAMESDGAMSGKDFMKLQQHFTFGFGYTIYLNKKK